MWPSPRARPGTAPLEIDKAPGICVLHAPRSAARINLVRVEPKRQGASIVPSFSARGFSARNDTHPVVFWLFPAPRVETEHASVGSRSLPPLQLDRDDH